MQILEQLGLALGLATLAGVNLYLTVLLTGLAIRFDLLHLAEKYQSLEALGHPVVLVVAGVLFCLEFFADKVPWVDTLWDSVHTFIRPVGGVMLGLQALGDVPPYMQVVSALVAGGAALTTHSAKAGTRLLINHSPEPVSNIAMSVGEDVAVVGGVALTLLNPVVALIVFTLLLIAIWLIFPRLWRSGRATLWLIWHKLKMPGKSSGESKPAPLPCEVSDDLRDLLRFQTAITDKEVAASLRCLSARCKGIQGLKPNLNGLLVFTHYPEHVYFSASRTLGDKVYQIPLKDATITSESKFLSETLTIESPGVRVVFRFPRGQAEVVELAARALRDRQPAPEAPATRQIEATLSSETALPVSIIS
ncbi:hypothetical protein BH11VER1_BH11VER1_41740 [soil metagenome]